MTGCILYDVVRPERRVFLARASAVRVSTGALGSWFRPLGPFCFVKLVVQLVVLLSAFSRVHAQQADSTSTSSASKEFVDACSTTSNPSRTAEVHLQSAMKYWQSDSLVEARSEFLKALECDPLQCKSRLMLGNIASTVGAYKEAVEHFQKALTCDSSLNEARLALAKACFHLGNVKAATLTLESAALSNPGQPEIFALLTMGYTRQNRTDDTERAKELYTEARKLQLAEMAASQSHWLEALNNVSDYLAVFPKSSTGLLVKAGILQNGFSQSTEAIGALQLALNLNPTNNSARHLLVALYWIRGDSENLEHELKMSLRYDPTDSIAYYYLGRREFENGLLSEARTHLERAHLYDRDNWRIATNLAVVYEALHLDEQAEVEHRAALAIIDRQYVSEPWAYINYGAFLLNHQRDVEALTVLKRALTLKSPSSKAFFLAGVAAARGGELEESVRLLKFAISVAPTDRDTHLALASVYERLGRSKEALAERMASMISNPQKGVDSSRDH
jgi:tetratricopeptide (TPR) repeat protein